jgi:hypothetical protein
MLKGVCCSSSQLCVGFKVTLFFLFESDVGIGGDDGVEIFYLCKTGAMMACVIQSQGPTWLLGIIIKHFYDFEQIKCLMIFLLASIL